MLVILPLESRLPTVIEYPAAFAKLAPVTPSNPFGFSNPSGSDDVWIGPLNLTVSLVDLPWDYLPAQQERVLVVQA